jgi:hypothetical protein
MMLLSGARTIALRHIELENAAGALLDDGEKARRPARDLVQHRCDRGTARRDRHVDADALEQAEVRALAHARDDAANAELPAEERRQQVALVVVDHADEHVASADVLRFEELEIGAVALQDKRAAQAAGQQLAACGGAFDHGDVEGRVAALEPLRDLQPDVAAADDGHALAFRVRGAGHAPPHFLERGRRAHDHGLVAFGQLAVPARDEEGVAALDRDDERVVRQVQVGHSSSRQRRARLDPVLDELDGALGEALGIECTGGADDALDVFGELRLGPDHAIDGEGAQPARVLRQVEEILARDEADGLRLAYLPGHGATHDVHFVEAGAGDEDVGRIDTRAGLDFEAGAGAGDELDVERLKAIGDVGALIDDEDFVLLDRQRLCEGEADFPAPDDRYPHRRTL